MPKNQFQRMVYAFLTVLVTVHCYVFYSLYVVNGNTLMSLTGAPNVLGAIEKQGGIYIFGSYLPIWAIILIEFCFAYLLEMLLGSPYSYKLVSKVFDPSDIHPVLFETAIICTTVGLMCPTMSFIASILYYPYYAGFDIITMLADWLKLICFNLPFAFFTQLFFIQPLIRSIFKFLYSKEAQLQKLSFKK